MIGFRRNRTSGDTPFAAISEVEAYWQGLRVEGCIPSRQEIDPSRIQRALPYSFVLECITPRVSRIRIAGSKVSGILGLDLRGMPATCLISPAERDGFQDLLTDVFQMPATARINLAWNGGWPVASKAQMVLLPLLDHDGCATRALGCLAYETMPVWGGKGFCLQGSVVKPILKPKSAPIQIAKPNPAPLTLAVSNRRKHEVSPSPKVTPHLKLIDCG